MAAWEKTFAREAWRLKDFETFECSAIASLFSKPMQKETFRHRRLHFNVSLLQQTLVQVASYRVGGHLLNSRSYGTQECLHSHRNVLWLLDSQINARLQTDTHKELSHYTVTPQNPTRGSQRERYRSLASSHAFPISYMMRRRGFALRVGSATTR